MTTRTALSSPRQVVVMIIMSLITLECPMRSSCVCVCVYAFVSAFVCVSVFVSVCLIVIYIKSTTCCSEKNMMMAPSLAKEANFWCCGRLS